MTARIGDGDFKVSPLQLEDVAFTDRARVHGVNSSSKCTTGYPVSVKDFERRSIIEAFSGSMVEQMNHFFKF